MFDKKPKGAEHGAKVREIKDWTREIFGPPDATVMVSELHCTEPGCPPVETVIAILRGPNDREQHKVFRPLAEVTRQDVENLRKP